MEAKEIHEVVKKLVGPIKPVGESHKDEERFKNLEAMCLLIIKLVHDVDEVAYDFRENIEASIKKASDYATKFMAENLAE